MYTLSGHLASQHKQAVPNKVVGQSTNWDSLNVCAIHSNGDKYRLWDQGALTVSTSLI